MPLQKSKIDIIDKILNASFIAFPDALFIQSLMHQYEQRGSLSKKQLEGLFLKAQKVTDIPENWLGTLEAIIKKMPTRFKSEKPENTKPYQKNEKAGSLIKSILLKAPQHRQAQILNVKYENNQELTPQEIKQLETFESLLIKKENQ